MATASTHRISSSPFNARLLLRIGGAGLLAATAGIHLHLYHLGYSDIPHIGALFMANVVIGTALALAVSFSPGRVGRLSAVAGALFELGTLLGLIVTVTHGLFGFQDTTGAPLFWPAVIVESVGTVVLLSLTWVSRGR